MLNTTLKTSLLAISITSILSACGGGGGGSTPTGDTATKVSSVGTITEFGSVIVNNVHFETKNARIISADDNSVIIENPSNEQLQSILGLGNVITVRGSRSDDSNGVADSISFDDELVGEISSISAADGTFVVLGQTVSVTPDTIIDDSIIETLRGTEVLNDLRFEELDPAETLDLLLSVGLTVEISGFPSQNGLEATRIEDVNNRAVDPGNPDTDQQEDEVKGFVKNLAAGQFEINGLTIMFDPSVLDDDFPATGIAEGQFVEVHGSANGTVLTATRIELEDDFLEEDSNDDEIEIEGVIQQIRPDITGTGGIVVINGIELTVNDISQFSEGLKVEIKGTLQADGSIDITRLKDEAEDTIRIQDLAVSADAISFTTRLGLVISPTDRSRLEDDSIEDDDDLSIGAFLGNVVDKRVEARGFPLNDETAWTRLEIEKDADTDCRLRGPVANINGDASSFEFTIEGVTINVAQVSENNFEGSADLALGRSAFFDQLNDGNIVQATSDKDGNGCTNGILTARGVEFEPENDVLIGDDTNSNDDLPDNELSGTVSNFSTDGLSFDIAGETVTVNDDTLIDDSIIEDARGTGVELPADLPLGDASITETLQDLLTDGNIYTVNVDRSNGIVVTSIED